MMKFAVVLLAVSVVYVAGKCNHQLIIDNCKSFAEEMRDPNRQNDKKSMCKTLEEYLKCIDDAGCTDDQAYEVALEGMRATQDKMDCSSATGLVSSLTTLLIAGLAFQLSK